VPASTKDLYTEQGASLSFTFTWTTGVPDPDHPGQFIPGPPYDLTGWIGRMQVRPTVDSDTKSVDATTENDMIVLGGTSGTVSVHLPASETDKITYKKGVYDLELEAPDGRVVRLLQGKVINSLNVTR